MLSAELSAVWNSIKDIFTFVKKFSSTEKAAESCSLLSHLFCYFCSMSDMGISVPNFPLFFQISQKSLTTFHNIFISRIKISCIPRIRNIPSRTCKCKKLIYLTFRIIFQHSVKITDICRIHTNDIIRINVICPCYLLGPVRH